MLSVTCFVRRDFMPLVFLELRAFIFFPEVPIEVQCYRVPNRNVYFKSIHVWGFCSREGMTHFYVIVYKLNRVYEIKLIIVVMERMARGFSMPVPPARVVRC